MKNKLALKANAQKHHTVKRASERLGINLNDKQLDDLVKQVQTQKGKFLGRQSNRLTVWLLSAQGSQFVAVYDSQRKTFATVYPYSWWQERNPDHVIQGEAPICGSNTQEGWDYDW